MVYTTCFFPSLFGIVLKRKAIPHLCRFIKPVGFPTRRKQNIGENHSSMDLKPVSAILASEELNHLTRHLCSYEERQFLIFLQLFITVRQISFKRIVTLHVKVDMLCVMFGLD